MKKILSVVVAVVAVVNVVFCLRAFAAESDIIYEGDAENFVSDDVGNHLFGDFTTLYPGDEIARDISLKNDSDNTVSVYLKAQPVQSRYEPFLDLMTLSVYDSMGIRVSRSDDAQTGGIKNHTLIARLPPGSKTSVSVIFHIDSRMGSEFQGVTDKIRWIFSAESSSEEGDSVSQEENQKLSAEVSAAEISVISDFADTAESVSPIEIPDKAIPKTGGRQTEIYIALTALGLSFVIALIAQKTYKNE